VFSRSLGDNRRHGHRRRRGPREVRSAALCPRMMWTAHDSRGSKLVGQNDHRIVPRPARRAPLAAVDALTVTARSPWRAGRGRARSRSGPHGSDAGSTPAAEASAGRGGGHLGYAATSSGFTVDLWEEGMAHPTWDHHGGVCPRGAARVRRRIPGDLHAGGDFATSNSVVVFLPNPDFQHLVRVPSPTASRGACR
jgi:hypothetical protein